MKTRLEQEAAEAAESFTTLKDPEKSASALRS
jgi:hypothetical protein